MIDSGYSHCDCCMRLLNRAAMCPVASCIVLLLAAMMALRILMKIICCLCSLAGRCIKGRNLLSYGEWALITGASDGIGRALALQLAKEGFTKFILVARNEQKLKDTATQVELVSSSPVTVCCVAVDFATESSETIFKKISEAVDGRPVGVLVNNVGISYPNAMYYDEVPLSLIDDLININVRSALVVTRAVLPGMKARKRGLVVCVGSGAAALPSDPLYAAYASTKAAADGLCRSLQVEAAPFGISVQCHVPLLVTTKLSKCKTPGMMTPTPAKYAECATHMMGRTCCTTTISPYLAHALILGLANLMPGALWAKIRLSQCLSLRERALKKKEEQKKDS